MRPIRPARPARQRRIRGAALAVSAAGLLATDAQAVLVSIDTGGYQGIYFLPGSTVDTEGNSTVDLAPGTHTLGIGGFVNGSLSFDVAADGTVSTTAPGVTGGANSLTFATTDVTIEANGFQGQLRGTLNPGRAFSEFSAGDQTYRLVRGVGYGLDNGAETRVFRVEADGSVAPDTAADPDNAAAFEAGSAPDRLRLRTSDITLSPGDFAGSLRGPFNPFRSFTSFTANVDTTVKVVNGFTWQLDNGAGSTGFFVDAGGRASNTSAVFGGRDFSASLDILGAGADVVAFRTSSVTIDPGDFEGTYDDASLSSVVGGFNGGVQTFTAIKGMAWAVNLRTAGIRFDVDAAGAVTSQRPGSATGAGGTLRFENVLVDVDPTTFTGPYSIEGIAVPSGPATLTLIPELRHQLRAGNPCADPQCIGTFTPGAGGVDPGFLDLTVAGSGTHRFVFSVTPSPASVPAPGTLVLALAGLAALRPRRGQGRGEGAPRAGHRLANANGVARPGGGKQLSGGELRSSAAPTRALALATAAPATP